MKLVNSSVRNSATITTSLIRHTAKLSCFFSFFFGSAAAGGAASGRAISFIAAVTGRRLQGAEVHRVLTGLTVSRSTIASRAPNGRGTRIPVDFSGLHSWHEGLAGLQGCRKGESGGRSARGGMA